MGMSIYSMSMLESASLRYPVVQGSSDGRDVLGFVPNTSSISASLTAYEELPGIRDVPLSEFHLTGKSYSESETKCIIDLAEKIGQSNKIAPLIVVIEPEGSYILEGSHRADALFLLGAKSFPALVVVSLEGEERVASFDTDSKKTASSEVHPFDAMKAEMEARGFRFVPARSPDALNYGGDTYPTFIDKSGVLIAISTSPLYEHNRVVMRAYPDAIPTPELTLEAILTPEGSRGKGLAGDAQKRLLEAADAVGITLSAEPVPLVGKKSLDKKSLVEWYKRHGWVSRSDQNDLILDHKPVSGAPFGDFDLGVKNVDIEKLAASPTEKITQTPVYHATSKTQNGESILRDGVIRVPESIGKGFFAPVKGRAYCSSSLETAAIYALGGVMMGHEMDSPERLRNLGRYGYIFEVDSSSLQDVQPDEDSVGKLVANGCASGAILSGHFPGQNGVAPYWLIEMAKRYVAPSRLRKAVDGEYAYWASIGKQLLSKMRDDQKLQLIEVYGAHIAHGGDMKVLRAWKLDKFRSKEIANDGSNVLAVAEEVPVGRAAVASGLDLVVTASAKTELPAFKAWFGDSKVVDEDGNPLVVHHGTLGGKFNVFDQSSSGRNMGEFGRGGVGFFFVDDRGVAATYADPQNHSTAMDNASAAMATLERRLSHYEMAVERTSSSLVKVVPNEDGFSYEVHAYDEFGAPYNYDGGYIFDTEKEAREAGDAEVVSEIAKAEKSLDKYLAKEQAQIELAKEKAHVFDVYLKIVNPEVIDFDGTGSDMEYMVASIQEARKAGHDGVIFTNIIDALENSDSQSNVYVVFNASQIKSATDNSGAFDETKPDITASFDIAIKTAKAKWRPPTYTMPGGTVLYHGTLGTGKFDMKSFSWFTDDRETAEEFSGGLSSPGDGINTPSVLEFVARTDIPLLDLTDTQDYYRWFLGDEAYQEILLEGRSPTQEDLENYDRSFRGEAMELQASGENGWIMNGFYGKGGDILICRPDRFLAETKTKPDITASFDITVKTADLGREFSMPQAGTTVGDTSLPLYRFVAGDELNQNYLGVHWTHSRKDVDDMASDEPGFIITAKHPGVENVMDWENPNDRSIMERKIGGYEYRGQVFPEVPVRPGTKMDIVKIEKIDSDWKRSIVKTHLGLQMHAGFDLVIKTASELDIPHDSMWKRYDGATKGPALIHVIKNPSNIEMSRILREQSYGDEIGAILTEENVYAFRRDLEFHANVAKELGLSGEYVGVLLGANYAMVTDATRSCRHTSKAAELIRKMLPQVNEISYFDEAIVGDWEDIEGEEKEASFDVAIKTAKVEWNPDKSSTLKTYWKAHVQSDFVNDPSLISGNGVGVGGDLFRDFGKMVAKLGKDKFFVAPVTLSDSDVWPLGDGVVRSKVSKLADGDFAPVEWWMSHISKAIKTAGGDSLVQTLWHVSNSRFKKFDSTMTSDGMVWFAKDGDHLVSDLHGASVNNRLPVYLYKCEVQMGKVAGWDEYDKKMFDQLRSEGFDTIELDDDVAVLNENNIKIVGVDQVTKTNPNVKSSTTKISTGVIGEVNFDTLVKTASSDTEYMAAVKAGDTETAQRMVNELADKMGFNTISFHGSEAGDFTSFKVQRTARGYFFSPDQDTAGFYGPARKFRLFGGKWADLDDIETFNSIAENAIFNTSKSRDASQIEKWVNSLNSNDPDDRLLIAKLYGDSVDAIDRDFEGDWDQAKHDADVSNLDETIIESLPEEVKNSIDRYAPLRSEKLEWAREAYGSQEFYINYQNDFVAAAQNMGYDGVILTDPAGSTGGESISHVVFNSNSIKLFDAVTKDDDGNVIPLSQRFDTDSNDIRFDDTAPVIRKASFDIVVKTASSDAEYIAAVEAGDMETAQRMVNEAAKSVGYNVGPVWHGTGNKITSFDSGKISNNFRPKLGNGFYFSDSKSVAEHYMKNGDNPHLYMVYLLMNKPLEVASVKEYREAAMPNIVDPQSPTLSYDEVLKRKGYDGVILENGTIREIVAFYPSQIKSADPVVRDGDGKVIPLSKRFSSSDDIRLDSNVPVITTASFDVAAKTASSDQEYMDVVECGDLEAAQKMVNEAAKSAGYTIGPVYHGTNAKFNKFDESKIYAKVFGKGFYFVDCEDVATGFGSKIMRTFLRLKNPQVLQMDDGEITPRFISGPEKHDDADSIIIQQQDAPTIYVAKSHTQIKSADPITRDDDGQVVPLSKRFSDSDDIRMDETAVVIRKAESSIQTEEAFDNGDKPEDFAVNIQEPTEYRGGHQAPMHDSGAPLHDLTKNGIYPSDVYERPSWYSHSSDQERIAMNIALSYQGSPNKRITVYRAVPKSAPRGINVGDWVAITRGYAKKHGEELGEFKIIQQTVYARDIFTEGDSMAEWGYDPQPRDLEADLAMHERRKEKRKTMVYVQGKGWFKKDHPGGVPAPMTQEERDNDIKRKMRIKGWDWRDGQYIKIHAEKTAQTKTEVPNGTGVLPLPPGHIRLYHYTNADPEVIRKEGLKLSMAKGNTYGEPNMVWASSVPMTESKNVVEFSTQSDDPSMVLEKPRKEQTPDDWMSGNHHVGFNRDIKPDEILAIHEPWHKVYRYIKNNHRIINDVVAGQLDDIDEVRYPNEFRAILEVKRELVVTNGGSDLKIDQRQKLASAQDPSFKRWFGDKVKRAFRNSAIASITINAPEIGSGWLDGGCRILARALKIIEPSGNIVTIVRHYEGEWNADHYGYEFSDGGIVDGEGFVSDKNAWLERFIRLEMLNNTGEMKVVDGEVGSDEIPTIPSLEHALADSISKFLSGEKVRRTKVSSRNMFTIAFDENNDADVDIVDINGEYWIVDGDINFADGDVGDIDHTGLAIQHATGLVLDALDIEPNWESILINDYQEEIADKFREEGLPEEGNVGEFVVRMLTELSVEDTYGLYETAKGNGDPRQYALKHWGWKRYISKTVETQTLTNEDLDDIVGGLSSIMDGSGIDEKAREYVMFDIWVVGSRIMYRNIPYSVLSEKNIMSLRDYWMRYSSCLNKLKTANIHQEFEFDVEVSNLKLVQKDELEALRGELSKAANEILDEWEQDVDGVDMIYGSGGCCDAVARAMSSVLSIYGYDTSDGGQDGDDHAFVVVNDGKRAFAVDINPRVYETGGGYIWKKLEGAHILPKNIEIFEVGMEAVAKVTQRILTASEDIVAYHGSGTDIQEFSYEFTGAGNDQYGSGFYFTTDEQEAVGYTCQRIQSDKPKPGGEDKPTVLEVRLDIRNPLDAEAVGTIPKNKVRKLIMMSPVLDESLIDWGDVDFEGREKVLSKAVDAYAYQATRNIIVKALFPIANDFYRGHIKAFNEAVTKVLGYDGVVKKYDNPDGCFPMRTHYIVFRPDQIKIVGRRTVDKTDNSDVVVKTAVESGSHLELDERSIQAIENTRGARYTEDGIEVEVERRQHPDQSGATSVRSGVFYQPSGSYNKFPYSGKYGYGGLEQIKKKLLLKNPLFVKGATGGKAPQMAYDMVKGRGAFEKMNSDVKQNSTPWLFGQINYKPESNVKAIRKLLVRYEGDVSVASDIERVFVNKIGNGLRYAILENIVANVVRNAGYDSIVGYSIRRDGTPFLSEVFNLNETTYPNSKRIAKIDINFPIVIAGDQPKGIRAVAGHAWGKIHLPLPANLQELQNRADTLKRDIHSWDQTRRDYTLIQIKKFLQDLADGPQTLYMYGWPKAKTKRNDRIETDREFRERLWDNYKWWKEDHAVRALDWVEQVDRFSAGIGENPMGYPESEKPIGYVPPYQKGRYDNFKRVKKDKSPRFASASPTIQITASLPVGYSEIYPDDSFFDVTNQLEFSQGLAELEKESGINILRDKDINSVVIDTDGKTKAALYTSFLNNEFGFDVVVAKDSQGKGIGSHLIDRAISDVKQLVDEGFDFKIDVVNPMLVDPLKRRGFEVTEEVGGHTLMGLWQTAGSLGVKMTDKMDNESILKHADTDLSNIKQWLEGSVVKTPVYHGSISEPFDSFDPSKRGKGVGSSDEHAFFFASNPDEAEWYRQQASQTSDDESEGHVGAYYLRLTNPYYPKTSEFNQYNSDAPWAGGVANVINTAKAAVHDGYVYEDKYATVYAVFDASQIKKAEQLKSAGASKNTRKVVLSRDNSQVEISDRDYEQISAEYSEKKGNMVNEMISSFRSDQAKNRKWIITWPLISAARLQKIWNDYSVSGVVRDVKGMQEIADSMFEGIIRLKISNEISGHSVNDARVDFEDIGYEFTDGEWRHLIEGLENEKGEWYVSDYGCPKLEDLIIPLKMAKTAEDQLLVVDQMLNVCHQRGDLAEMFVEGGSATLNNIFLSGTEKSASSQNRHFLSNADSAWEWVKENADIELDSADQISSYRDRAEQYSDMYNRIRLSPKITIYRALLVSSIDDIRWGELGTHWSFQKEGVGTYGASRPKETDRVVVITGEISSGHIDWEYGFISFVYYGDSQWECALISDSPVSVLAIDDKPIQPIQAVAMVAGETKTAFAVDNKVLASKGGWFGNSKVVDDSGKPLVVYHGSRFPMIESFHKEFIGTGITKGLDPKPNYGGFFFSSDPENASSFADYHEVPKELSQDHVSAYGEDEEWYYSASDDEGDWVLNGGPFKTSERAEQVGVAHVKRYNAANKKNEDMFVRGYNLKIENPFNITGKEMFESRMAPSDLVPIAKDAGHDGVIIKGLLDGTIYGDVYIVFNGSQIKHVSGVPKMAAKLPQTPEELAETEFAVPEGGHSITPKRAFEWRNTMINEPGSDHETLADLASYSDQWRFEEALGKGWEHFCPNSLALAPAVKSGKQIKIFRASNVGGGIWPGSYVTESITYAKKHGEIQLDGHDWKLYSLTVWPDELVSLGDSHEFIYVPRDAYTAHKRMSSDVPKNEEQSKSAESFEIVITGKLNLDTGVDDAPASGHLDTQLFENCKGTKFDRDVVSKNRRRKKNRKAFAQEDRDLDGELIDELNAAYLAKWIPVESSVIREVAYSEPTGRLEFKMKNFREYSFHGVSKEEFDSFMTSPSKGKWFSDFVNKRKSIKKQKAVTASAKDTQIQAIVDSIMKIWDSPDIEYKTEQAKHGDGLNKIELGEYEDVKIFLVNGNCVKKEMMMDFVEGGHDAVYGKENGENEHFMPNNEVWIDAAVYINEIPYVIAHELFERNKMTHDGVKYEEAHTESNEVEHTLREEKLFEKVRKILKFPIIRQSRPGLCGHACICMVLQYYNEDVTTDGIFDEASEADNAEGLPPETIKRIIEDHGAKAEIVEEMTIEDIKSRIDQGIPVIVEIQAWPSDEDKDMSKSNKDGHYAVAIGYTASHIVFSDPSSYQKTFLENDEMENRWHDIDSGKLHTKVGIVVTKNNSDEYYNEKTIKMGSEIAQTAKDSWGKAGAGVLYFCPDDQTIMLLRRSEEVEDPGIWGIPGGAVTGTECFFDSEELENVEFDNETLQNSAHKETEEEIGHLPDGPKDNGSVTIAFGNFKYTTFRKDVTAEQKELINKNHTLNWESSELQWFPVYQLPKDTHPGVVQAVQKLFGG